MKKFVFVVFLPVVLFALERVNLVKDWSFEKDNSTWQAYAHGRGSGQDSASASCHSSDKSNSGSYCAFSDTRKTSACIGDSGVIIQGYQSKFVSDIDSLYAFFSVIPLGDGFEDSLSDVAMIGLFVNSGKPGFKLTSYFLRAPDIASGTPPPPWFFIAERSFYPDTEWHSIALDIQKKLISDAGVPMEASVDSIFLTGWGANLPPWRGQMIYWDAIRLTGYADYDVGVKGFVSKDSVWMDTGYTPTARIKNFGRKPADSFLVIAQIGKDATPVYADTLSWSLVSDTEDTVSFKEFKPSDALNYTLTVSTVMTPDESDEDDAMSKTLFGTGIVEQPTPAGVVFNVSSFSSCPQVSYSLPLGEQGTISLYDPAGRRIEFLSVQGSGSVSLKSGLSSGVYFVKLETGKTSVTRKAVVLR